MTPLWSCVHKSCVSTLPVDWQRGPAEELLCWHVQTKGASPNYESPARLYDPQNTLFKNV